MVKLTATSVSIEPRPRGIYVGTSGTIDITNEDLSTESAVAVVAGSVIPCQFLKVTAITDAEIYGLHDVG